MLHKLNLFDIISGVHKWPLFCSEDQVVMRTEPYKVFFTTMVFV